MLPRYTRHERQARGIPNDPPSRLAQDACNFLDAYNVVEFWQNPRTVRRSVPPPRHLTCLVTEIVGASRFEQSAKGCHEYAQCLSRDDSRRARVEHRSPAGVRHQFLQPRDDEQSRHARLLRPTGRTNVAPRFPHASPLRSVWIRRHSRRSPLTLRGSAVRSISMRRCELPARPLSSARERRVKDGTRRISKTQPIVITIGPRILYLSGRFIVL